METQTQSPETVKVPTFKRFFKWLTGWRTIRRFLFTVVVIGTLIAAGFTYSNVTGKRMWEQCKQRLEAQGEVLDWKAYVPPPIPDEKNFAATPALVILKEKWNKPEEMAKVLPTNYDIAYDQMRKLQTSKSSLGPVDRELINLPAWAAGFEKVRTGKANPISDDANKDPAQRKKAAAAVLEDLKLYVPILRELREARASRPGGRFNINYDEPNPIAILLPHLAQMKKLAGMLRLKASAELAVGLNEEAYQDVLTILRLAETVQNDCILISYLVNAAMLRIAVDAAWEGLATGQWTSPQLESLQAQFAKLNMVADAQKVLRAERAFFLKFIEYLRTGPETHRVLQSLASDTQENVSASACLFSITPNGWLYKEQANYALIFQDMFLANHDYASGRIYPEKAQAAEKLFETRARPGWHAFWNHYIFTGLLVPAIEKIPMKAAEIQTVMDEAALACALERYRRAKGEYPEQLEALAPQLVAKLPFDVITGKPLIYKRTADGGFVLYGVAWDGQDDGGLIVRKNVNLPNQKQDWVWQYPAKGETAVQPTR